MDFQKKTEDYNEVKKCIAETKSSIDKLREEMAKLNARKSKASEKELEKIENEYEEVEQQLFTKKDTLKRADIAINEIIKQVAQDPSVKKVIDKALGEKYDKNLKKTEDELKTLNDKKTNQLKDKGDLKLLIHMVEQNPENAKTLTEFIEQKKEYINLEKELEGLTKKDIKKDDDLKRIGEIHLKLDSLKGPIAQKRKEVHEKMNKIGITITEDRLDEIAKTIINNGIEQDKSGNTDINKTLKGNVNKTDKQLADTDKVIKRKNRSIIEYTFAKEQLENGENTPTNPVTTEKPKWYQFGKRFSEWMNNRKREKLPEPTTELTDDVLKSELFNKARKQRTDEVNNKRQSFMKAYDCTEKAKEIEKNAQEQVKKLMDEAQKNLRDAGLTKEEK